MATKYACLDCQILFTKKTLDKYQGKCCKCSKKDNPNINSKYITYNNHSMITELFDICTRLSNFEEKYGFNSTDNYKNREILVGYYIRNIDPSYQCNMSRGGYDFKNSRTEKGECKSAKLKGTNIDKVKFEFDKQNLLARRKKTLQYKAFVFAIFKQYLPVSIFYINTDTGVEKIITLIESKQQIFVQEHPDFNQTAKRDTINISVDAIKNVLLPEEIILLSNI